MVVEFPCSVFTCDPRFNEIEQQIDDMRVGDLNSHTLIDVWYDGPDDFVYWIKEDMYDGKYDCITTILSVIRQYLDSRSSDDYDYEFEQDGLFFDSTLEVQYYNLLKNSNLAYTYLHGTKKLLYLDKTGKQHTYWPDLEINGKLVEIKTKAAFNSDRYYV